MKIEPLTRYDEGYIAGVKDAASSLELTAAATNPDVSVPVRKLLFSLAKNILLLIESEGK